MTTPEAARQPTVQPEPSPTFEPRPPAQSVTPPESFPALPPEPAPQSVTPSQPVTPAGPFPALQPQHEPATRSEPFAVSHPHPQAQFATQPEPSPTFQPQPPPHTTTPPEPFPGSQPQPQPIPRSRAPIVLLTALATVAAITTGIFTVLYLGERADRDATAATRADRERVLADVRGQQDELDRALEANRSRQSALSSQNSLLSTCVEAAKMYFDLPAEQSPESSRLFRVMYDVCPQII